MSYYSKLLCFVDCGLVPCLCDVGGTTDVVLVCANIVAMPLTVFVPHSVHALISLACIAYLVPLGWYFIDTLRFRLR